VRGIENSLWPALLSLSQKADPLDTQTLIYPRLVLALNARTRLHAAHLATYSSLLQEIQSLSKGPGCRLIRGEGVAGVDERGGISVESEGEGAAKDAKGAASVQATEQQKGFTEKELNADPPAVPVDTNRTPDLVQQLPPPAPVLRPIGSALQALATALSAPNTTLSPTPPRPPAAPAAEGSESLLRSLSTLNGYLESESYATVTSAYRSYGASTGGSKDCKALHDAVVSLKAEIRSVKGAFHFTFSRPARSSGADPRPCIQVLF
jgi:hypothetical protein